MFHNLIKVWIDCQRRVTLIKIINIWHPKHGQFIYFGGQIKSSANLVVERREVVEAK
uniref:Uncharacterized protein n=1 Tax=Physcomitrium patens TaxID=3218 RepID=A0A2K1IJ62_PHYPA|nr:hypothetical protein PHYPA_028010 [Physcomitrium patens]